MTLKLNLLNHSDLSAGQLVAEKLMQIGIERDSITGNDLQELYGKLKTVKGSASQINNTIDLPLQTQPTQHEVTAVIVETRQHRNLEFVVCQCAENLGLDIQIFHSRSNKGFLMKSEIGKLVEKGQVTLVELNVTTLNASDYNTLLLSQSFWDALNTRNKILILQTDSVLCQNSNYHLNDFMSFDYIGSKWSRMRPVGIKIDGGNGGFSLRDWKKSTECLRRFPSSDWPGGEDGYFAFHLDIMGAKVGRSKDCAKFSSQSEFDCKSFACHSIHLMNDRDLNDFLEYAPEAKTILP